MRSEGLSAVKLAEMIDVQPSAISHIISGRNKPGFDFLAALFARFPDISPRWMILGEGEMSPMLSNADVESAAPPVVENTPQSPQPKSIERIAIFYTDGTFSSYNP